MGFSHIFCYIFFIGINNVLSLFPYIYIYFPYKIFLALAFPIIYGIIGYTIIHEFSLFYLFNSFKLTLFQIILISLEVGLGFSLGLPLSFGLGVGQTLY